MILNQFCKKNGYAPRLAQSSILQKIENEWDNYDVFVVRVPTAGGKTYISDCIQQFAAAKNLKSHVVVSDNNLLAQAERDFAPEAAFMYAKRFYECTWKGLDDRPVKGTRDNCPWESCKKRFTNGCPYTRAANRWKNARCGVSNYWMPMAHKNVNVGCVIIDESHLYARFLASLSAKRLWHKDFRYPLNADSYAEIRDWLTKEVGKWAEPPKRTDPRWNDYTELKLLLTEITKDKQDYCVVSTEAEYRGQMLPCLEMRPIEVRSALPLAIPKTVSKIFLLSATMSKHDIDELGILGKRVLYLDVASPIPADRRPVKVRPILSNRKIDGYKDAKYLLEHILEVAERFPTDKGLVHMTYHLASQLKMLIGKYPELMQRAMFHDKHDKKTVLQSFLQAPPESGKILFGCGLQEGLDLKDDLARFNIIAKINWPSLEAPENARLLENNPEHYAWLAARSVMQAAGRVCRNEMDYGETYILDSSFKRIPEHLWLPYFREALIYLQ